MNHLSARDQLAQIQNRRQDDLAFKKEAERRGYVRKRIITQADLDAVREIAMAADFGGEV